MSGRQRLPRLARVIASLLVAAAVIGLGSLWVSGFSKDDDDDDDGPRAGAPEQAVKTPHRVSTKNGQLVITLDAETQQRSGIEVAALPSFPHQEQVRAYGTVLDAGRLTTLSNNLVSARAELQTAKARLARSRPAFERAQSLYENQKAVSLAEMQSTEAAVATDQASLAASQAQERTLTATAYQEWGSVLGKALIESAPMVERLIERQDFLVQVTLPPRVLLAAAPSTATMETGRGAGAPIAFVSPATRIDPKIQGISFFYTAAADSGVLPGMNVLALLPSGKTIDGVGVPAPAVVWWQDHAWAYRRVGADTFTRFEIATDIPALGGGYIVSDIPKDAEIVTRGAQLLLSEEFRALIQVDEDHQ